VHDRVTRWTTGHAYGTHRYPSVIRVSCPSRQQLLGTHVHTHFDQRTPAGKHAEAAVSVPLNSTAHATRLLTQATPVVQSGTGEWNNCLVPSLHSQARNTV